MKKKPVVSICCITYNHEKYIRDAIEGFLMQKTNFSFEILIHDDASTDHTQEIVESYRGKFPNLIRCKYQTENQKSKGRVIFPIILEMAQGKYVALCEGDDYWTDPYKLQKQVDFLEMHPEYSFCFHQVEMRDEFGKLLQKFIDASEMKVFELRDLLFTNFVATCSVLFRRENINVYELPREFFELKMGGDWAIHVLNARKGKFVYLPYCMAVYRIHKDGMWSSLSNKQKGLIAIYIMAKLNKMTRFEFNEQVEKGIKSRLVEHGINLEDLESQKQNISAEAYDICKKVTLDLAAHYEGLAETYLSTGEKYKALSIFEKLYSLVPREIQYKKKIGKLLLEMGFIEKSIECFKEILKIKQNDEEVIKILEGSENRYKLSVDTEKEFKIIKTLINSGRLDDAEKRLQSLIESHPFCACFFKELAGIHYRKGDKISSVQYLEHARRLNPDDILVLKNLANLYLEMEFFKKALDTFYMILEIKPGDQEVLRALKFHGKAIAYLNNTASEISYNNISLSIVIPVEHNKVRLKVCLESIKKACRFDEYEVNIIGEEVNVEVALHNVPADLKKNLRLYFLKNGESINEGINRICNESRTLYLLFLHPKLELTENSLFALKKAVTSGRAVAVVPKVTNSDDTLLEAGYSFINGQKWCGRGEGFPKDDPRFNYVCEINSGSRFCMLVSKDVWTHLNGFDARYECFSSALVDLGVRTALQTKKILYHPHSEFVFMGRYEDMDPEEKRPRIFRILSKSRTSNVYSSILVLGIYLANQVNNIEDIVLRLSETRSYMVEQCWISIGGKPPSPEVAMVTLKTIYEKKPKFAILNDLLLTKDLSRYEYVIIIDDDIILPFNFLDEFLYLQSKYEFVLAQPARTSNSFIDHPIVEQQSGVLARQTMFVEIGPLFSVHKSIYDIIFPFDLISPMGWGYENYWSFELMRKGLKMGIIDNTPIDHSMRKPIRNYNYSEVNKQRNLYWQKHQHLEYEECFRVVDVFTLRKE